MLSFCCITSVHAGATLSELLITEVAVTPTDGEFIEIHNRGGSIIDLTDVYLTDATFSGGGTYYYNIVTGTNAGGGSFADFHARFPSGATISPGEYQTVAMTGSTAFFGIYGFNPTYELFEDDGAADAIPDMLEAFAGSINGQGGLTNGGEVAILYYWDGNTDLVSDLDYVIWGDTAEAVDKSGIAIDGPDADADTSTYLNDTVIASQIIVSASTHASGNSWQRADLTEGTETQTGGNGIAGSNETSENLNVTFVETMATPNAAYTPPPPNYGALLITEISIIPTEGEFIEIHNNGLTSIDLTDVYLTDATFSGGGTYYYNIVTGANAGGGGFADFHARFPSGATIAAGEYQTIALSGSTNFNTTYGVNPTYELYEDDGAPDAIPDMLEAVAGSINNQGGLTDNSGEVVILYTWDGMSDLVMDIDYVVWGDKVEAVDKTGILIDGPDADADTSAYLPDTSIASQIVIALNSHASGNTWQRSDLSEGVEVQTGGNGVDGSNETSEDTDNTFFEGLPSPNAASVPPPPSAPNVIINEVDAVSTAEFIELYGTSNASLTDVTVVLYQGSDDTIYDIIDISGLNMGSDGYFLIGDSSLTPEVTIPANTLHDDASAVAIYFSNASNFTIGGSLTTTDLMDALVYDSGQADDAGLLTLLNGGQAQIDENNNSNAATESNARCPNGSGGARNTSTYNQVTPTPAAVNNSCPLEDYYASVDPTNATTLRTTLHDIIKVAISFPYSNGSPNTWEVLSFADEDHNTGVDVNPNLPEAVWMVYKNDSYTYNGGGQQPYNREHTWPKSYGFSLPDDNAPRTDAHHLMMSDVGYNSTRGNKYFDYCNPANDGTCSNASLQTTEYDGDGDGITEGGDTGSTYPGNANWTNNSVFEVWNFRKGDIARAMFYMDVRYEGDQIDTTGTPEPDLILTSNPSLIQTTAGPTAYMGLLDVLLEWHALDPVDDIERERNEVVYSYQQNRNPFVDHPEWVECIFQDICPDDLIFENGFE